MSVKEMRTAREVMIEGVENILPEGTLLSEKTQAAISAPYRVWDGKRWWLAYGPCEVKRLSSGLLGPTIFKVTRTLVRPTTSEKYPIGGIVDAVGPDAVSRAQAYLVEAKTPASGGVRGLADLATKHIGRQSAAITEQVLRDAMENLRTANPYGVTPLPPHITVTYFGGGGGGGSGGRTYVRSDGKLDTRELKVKV